LARVPISFVLRLADAPLGDRRIAGQVEVVHTGEQATVRTSEELIAFLYEHAASTQRKDQARDDPRSAVMER
jgi:hypothetical protein